MVMEVRISGWHNHCPISGHASRLDDRMELPERYREKYKRVSPKRIQLPPDVEHRLKLDWLANKVGSRELGRKYGMSNTTLLAYVRRKGWPMRTTRPLCSYPLPTKGK